MASFSSSSSSSPLSSAISLQEKYDVFISFRGEDTRKGFASYLYAALSANQILTFMDDPELQRGDEISPTLRKAIEGSMISVIIFSENYASSTWCLDELVQILECRRTNGQIVMPIFYCVDSSVVRKQKGSYGVAFVDLEHRFKDRMEKLEQWRAALKEASDLCGLDSKDFSEGNKDNELWMHDLLRQMGRAIVRDEDEEPGNRSRLCDAMEICEVLENSMGTKAVEIISFKMSEIKKNVKVCSGAFSNMRNLRILKIYYFDDIVGNDFYRNNNGGNEFKLYIPQDLDCYLSNKITFFQWDFYPLKSLPSNFIPENLVELVLRGSHVEKLWDNCKVQSLTVLRRIDLSYSKFLTQLPDLSHSPNLESINLEGCTSLVQGSNVVLPSVHVFRYPGDEIPEWFSHQTCGTSLNNIMLPPYWNNDDFLGLAFCIVLRRNKIDKNISFGFNCNMNFKTIDDDCVYKYHDYTGSLGEKKVISSDHVVIWYVGKPTLRSSKWNMESHKEMDRLNWPSTSSTEASFHVWPSVNNNENEYCEIKKIGIRFVYKEDIERCDAETERKNKRRFNECCESSGSEAVGSLEEEDDDESHSKKLKLM